ncbi:MAG: GIY-YIG nuclease family protein [Planctomycetota bacterium]|jgi:predicted GIY-YIG superfamily endonuclease
MYVCLRRSQARPDKRYVGLTRDLKKRLRGHDAGKSPHTSKFAPWELVVAVHFADRHKAEAPERYLKEGSGHAFANRHFW